MTDYTFPSGDGQLMMRDLGTTVEFWVRAGYTNFWWDNLSFSTTVDGVLQNHSINYTSGAPWMRVASRNVANTQTVTFRLNTATGTNSLAGPTTAQKYFDRGARPEPPTPVRLSNIGATSMNFAFNDTDNNGLAADNHELWYNTVNTTTGARVVGTTGTGAVYALSSGVRWYFWARTHNAKGWSNFSPVSSAVTLRTPLAPSAPTVSNITQNSAYTKFSGNGDGGSPITRWELGYSTQNDVGTATVVTAGWDGSNTLKNLAAGQTYYFWARGVNAIGNGPWSVVSTATLLAGAWLKVPVAGTNPPQYAWVRAVPYVKVNGAWVAAETWGRSAGSWKKSAG